MLWMNVPTERFGPKLYLNGFPKSGLHWLELLVTPFVKPQAGGAHTLAMWVSSHKGVWSNSWEDPEKVCWDWSNIRNGGYLKGHCAFHPVLANFAWLMGMAQVFIYRDLRDVAVSQTFHIMSESPQFVHPGKGAYSFLGGFNEILTAVIEGLKPFPGIIERWEMYAPWLEQGWVHSIKFEDGLKDPKECAFNIIDYGIDRTVKIVGEHIKLSKERMYELAEKMAVHSRMTAASPTFREGKIGSWKEHFTDEHKDLFKEKAGDWLIKLGYEKDNKW